MDGPTFRRVICQRLVLVGDAHLGRGSPDTATAFLAFLRTVPTLGDGLLITGDLFEFWFAYRRHIPRHGIRVVAALAELARQLPILMLGGNHDRWAGDFWERELGIEFAPYEARLTVGGRPALALHGDGLTESHWSARVLHRILRHQSTVALYRSLHPELGTWLVDRLSGYLGDRPRPEAELQQSAHRQREWAVHRLAGDPSTAMVIMGHTHRPAVEAFPSGQVYVNPGAWMNDFRYARVADGQATLHHVEP